jgi:hypothetical protein
MKISLDEKNKDVVKLVNLMASKNREEREEAQAAVAVLMTDVVNEVIDQAPTFANFFAPKSFAEGTSPEIPLDLYEDITADNHFMVWQQTQAGGTPSQQIILDHQSLKFQTFPMYAAFNFDAKYARNGQVDVVGRTVQRILQEIMIKRDKTAFNTIATALLLASTKIAGASAAGNHIIGSTAENVLQLDDFNKLILRSKRLNTSYTGGTPVGGVPGVTDLAMSPEMVAKLRELAYNPVNTRQATSGTTSIAATDEMRNSLWSNAGIPNFFGINLMEFYELGIGQTYNAIFGALVAANSVTVSGGGGGSWATADDEVILGFDRTRESLLRPFMNNGNGVFTLESEDDLWKKREQRVGYFGGVDEGYCVTNDRVLTGLVV